MSDLRFARELGAQFERLERAGAADRAESDRRPFRSDTARLTGRFAIGVAFAVPVAIVVVALGLLNLSSDRGHHSATSASPAPALAFTGGNCSRPARTVAPTPNIPMPAGSSMIRAAGGRVAGIAWELLVKNDTETLAGTERGRLRVGAAEYGLCSQRSVPVPFGLISAGGHGIVYGYVAAGAGDYRITLSGSSTPLSTRVTEDFFIGALPHPACSYRSLSVTATQTGISGLPPSIIRSLDETAPRFTTTMRFGPCRSNALVPVLSASGTSQGRSLNAPLATQTAQLILTPPPGSGSRASGRAWELAHNGQHGINVLAFNLPRGPYGIWLLGPHGRTTAVATVTVRGTLEGAYDLPADIGRASQIVIATRARGPVDTLGTVVLRGTLR